LAQRVYDKTAADVQARATKVFDKERVAPNFFKGVSKDGNTVPVEFTARQDSLVIDGSRYPSEEAFLPGKERGGECPPSVMAITSEFTTSLHRLHDQGAAVAPMRRRRI
jgi:hypothetical protein